MGENNEQISSSYAPFIPLSAIHGALHAGTTFDACAPHPCNRIRKDTHVLGVVRMRQQWCAQESGYVVSAIRLDK